MEAAMRPIDDAGNTSMLHRIEMNVVDMALKIRVVADGVFPITPLPDALLSLADFTRRSRPGSRPLENPLLIKLQRVENQRRPPAMPKVRERDPVRRTPRSSQKVGVAERHGNSAGGVRSPRTEGCSAVRRERP
jgi:hypothetical protein